MAKKYPLGALLRIRLIRQDAAEKELTKCKQAVEQAKKIVEKQEWRIGKFKEWRTSYEDQLFKGIIGKMGKKSDVTDIKTKIENNKQRLEEHYKRLEKLQEALKKAEAAAEAALKAYKQAFFNVTKLKQHKDTWIEAANKEEEATMEKEAEEFKVKKAVEE